MSKRFLSYTFTQQEWNRGLRKDLCSDGHSSIIPLSMTARSGCDLKLQQLVMSCRQHICAVGDHLQEEGMKSWYMWQHGWSSRTCNHWKKQEAQKVWIVESHLHEISKKPIPYRQKTMFFYDWHWEWRVTVNCTGLSFKVIEMFEN